MNRCLPPLLIIFALVSFGCSPAPSPQATGTADGAAVATLVTAQLTAAAPTTGPEPAGSPSPEAPPPGLGGRLRVVYSQAGQLYVWDGAASKQLTSAGQDSEPKISSDGRLVVFRRGDELWAANTDGSGEHAVASKGALSALPHSGAGQVTARKFGFAPKSHVIYFNTSVAGEPFPVAQDDLVRVEADGAALAPLLNEAQGGDEFFFSPDGTQIALARSDKINVFKTDGSGFKTVFTFPAVMMYSEQSYIPEVVWMPDGSGFKTVIPAPDALGNPSALTRFMFIFADGSMAAQLAEFIATPAFKGRPYISPNGAQVLYLKPQGDKLELHIIDAGTADRAHFQHTASNFGVLGWAPDSARFVYWVDDQRHLWLGGPGAQPTALANGDPVVSIGWLDAERYIYMNDSGLYLAVPGQPGYLIAAGVDRAFDFVLSR